MDVRAPAVRSASTQARWLWRLASCKAVLPSRSRASTSAPCCRSKRTSARLPFVAAVTSGVAPRALRASIFAPRSSSTWILAGVLSVRAVWIVCSASTTVATGFARFSTGRASLTDQHPQITRRMAQVTPVLWCKRPTGPHERPVRSLQCGLYGLAYSPVRRHQQLCGKTGRFEGVKAANRRTRDRLSVTRSPAE